MNRNSVLIFLTTALLIVCCSQKDDDLDLIITLTDGAESPVLHLAPGEQRQTKLTIRNPNEFELGEVALEISAVECAEVSENQYTLAGLASVSGENEVVRPLNIKIPNSCAAGTRAGVVITAISKHGQRLVTGELRHKFTVGKHGGAPNLSISKLRINQLPRNSIFPEEELSFGIEVSNRGDGIAKNFTISLSSDSLKQFFGVKDFPDLEGENLKAGDSVKLAWPDPVKLSQIPENLPMELSYELKWVADDDWSGALASELLVAKRLFPANIRINGRSEQEFDAGDQLDLAFDLINESNVDLGPGRIWITDVRSGKINGLQDEIKFSDIFPKGFTKVTPGGLSVVSDVSSAYGMTVTFSWRTLYGYEGQFTLDLNSKEPSL